MPVINFFRHFGNYAKKAFCDKLFVNREHFNIILYTDDVNIQVIIFNYKFIAYLDDSAPYVTKEIKRPFAPWMTDQVRQAIKLKNKT